MSRLLHKPLKSFTLYALIILLCSVPVYYFVVNFIWLHELDEHNQIVRDQIVHRLTKAEIDPAELQQTLDVWNQLQPGTTITPAPHFDQKDSLYTISRQNEFIKGEVDRFRGLVTFLRIHQQPYRLRIETNVEEAGETIIAIGVVTLIFFVLLVVGFILLNRRISSRVWQPFYDTLDQLKTFDLAGNTSPSFGKSNIAEFDALHQVLQKLIENNIAAFKQQKIFIENAAHELQTPLAVLKSKTDLLLQNKDITGEQAEILQALQLHVARVSRINKNLLLLARIENSQFPEKENQDLFVVLNECIVLLDDYLSTRELVLDIKKTETFTVSCNKFLLETLLNNLLTNAIKHSPPQSSLRIEWHDRTLWVLNAGKSSLGQGRLFERFSISSSETTSSGLGLAIVREICHQYGWQVNYVFKNNQHCFSVTF